MTTHNKKQTKSNTFLKNVVGGRILFMDVYVSGTHSQRFMIFKIKSSKKSSNVALKQTFAELHIFWNIVTEADIG